MSTVFFKSRLLSGLQSLLLEVGYNISIPCHSVLYAIVLLQPGRHTAAATTATYSIEQPLALHNSVRHPSTMTLPHNFFSLLSGNLVKPFGLCLRIYLSAGTNDYLGHNRTIAVVKYLPAVTKPQSYIS